MTPDSGSASPPVETAAESRAGEGTASSPEAGLDRRRFGRFVLTGVLGVGGMGVVYRAWDPVLCREVALKLLRRDSPARKDRLLREARAQARLEHPGVCRIYEAGELDGEPFIAMQRINGRPLSERAARLNFQQKAEVGRQVAEALHAAHREGLIHRDVKPANILVEEGDDQSLHAWVTDFGLVRDLSEEGGGTQSGVILGTWSYMAPEQVRGESAAVDRRTDVYGLGATLYEVCSGQPPYGRRDPGSIAVAMAREEIVPLRRINKSAPADLEAVVLKCLETHPDRRYPSARELGEDLLRYLDGRPVLARRAGLRHRFGKWVRKRRYALSAAAAVLLTLLGFALFRAWEVGRMRRIGEQAERYIGLLSGVELRLMYAYLQPLHDIREDLQDARRQLGEIEQAMRREGPSAQGPGNYVLGRGELLLGDSEAAVRRLRYAWQAGYQRPEAAYSLARALVAEQERQLVSVQGLPDPEVRKARQAELDRAYGEEIDRYLALAAGSANEIPIEVYRARQAGRWEEAIRVLEQVQDRLRWPIEGQVLRLRLETQRADRARDLGRFEEARGSYGRAMELVSGASLGAPSYPQRHEAACTLATARLALHTTRGIDAESAYRQALSAADQYDRVIPEGKEAGRLRRQMQLLYASWRFSMGEYAREELDRLDAGADASLARDSRDVDAMRDKATAWRIRAFAIKEGYDGLFEGKPERMAAAIGQIGSLAEQIQRTGPLIAMDWHNLGSASRAMLEISKYRSPQWLEIFQQAERPLSRSVEREERFAPAHKDLGFIYYLRAIEEIAQARPPGPWLEKSLLHSRRAIRLTPDYFDAWDNLAQALGLSATAKAFLGEDPTADFDAAEKAFVSDAELNSERDYAYTNAGRHCFYFRARFEAWRGGDWEGVLGRYETFLNRWKNGAGAATGGYRRNEAKVFFELALLRADLSSYSGRAIPFSDYEKLRGLLPKDRDEARYAEAVSYLVAGDALRRGKRLTSSEGGAVRAVYLLHRENWMGGHLFADLPGSMLDLAESLAAQGISPEKDLQTLEKHEQRVYGNDYLHQHERKLIAGRAALIRAEWLCKTGSDGWTAYARQAQDQLRQAVDGNRRLEKMAAPYRKRAASLLGPAGDEPAKQPGISEKAL